MLKRLNTLMILPISIIIMLIGIESSAISAVSDDVTEIKSLLSRYQQGYQTKNLEVIRSCFEALGTVEEAKLKNRLASIEPISLTFTNIYIEFLTEPPRAYDAQLTCDAILAYTVEGETIPKRISQRYFFGLVQKESANALKEWKIRAMDIIDEQVRENNKRATKSVEVRKDETILKANELSEVEGSKRGGEAKQMTDFEVLGTNAQGTSSDGNKESQIQILREQTRMLKQQVELMEYQIKSKDPLATVLITLCAPFAVGHAYAGGDLKSWGRGMVFFAVDLVAFAILANPELLPELLNDTNDVTIRNFRRFRWFPFPIIKSAEILDAYLIAKRYNSQLQRRYNIDLSLRENSTVMQLNYAF